MIVEAYDGGSPSLDSIDDATVVIAVKRNLQKPVFIGTDFEIFIDETEDVNNSVFQFNVDDGDIDVS